MIDDSFTDGNLIYAKVNSLFFHPQGGGQPNDKLFDKNNNHIIIKNIDGAIFLGISPSIIKNGKADIFVDAEFNQLCSRLHSAGHLIAIVSERDFGIKTIKAHHFPNEAYIKFEGSLDKSLLDDIQEKLSSECLKDRTVHISQDKNGRFVNFDELGGYYCGGTHVKSLSEIGEIKLTSISNKKGMTTIKYKL